MIETQIVEAIKPFGPVYPFDIPDTIKGNAWAYRRIGNRVTTRYHDMDQQISEALFIVVHQHPNYIDLCDDAEFLSSINKYSSNELLSIRFDGYEDNKTTTGQYERQYRLIVLHKEII